MKKKFLAALVALVMLVSLLPGSVFAAAEDQAIQFTLVKDTTTFASKEVLRLDFEYKSGTNNPDSVFATLKYDATKLYPLAKSNGNDATGAAINMSNDRWGALVGNVYQIPAADEWSEPANATGKFYALIQDNVGYAAWKVETTGSPALADYTRLGSIFFGLKDGVAFNALPEDVITISDPDADASITKQTSGAVVVVDGGPPKGMNLTYLPMGDGADTLAAPAIVAGEGVKFAGSEPEVPEALNLAAEATTTTAKATLSSTYAEAKSGLLIVAAYNADGLVAVNSKSVTVTKETGDYVDVTFAATEGVTEVKAFLWSDFVNRTPLLAAATAAPVAE